ncbi:MAG: PilZ domain-containing protein [Candidatus Omnitrophica bacterium]|nr:PilZ domain-containing protein [Candidatus Omnitrophota bacterium]
MIGILERRKYTRFDLNVTANCQLTVSWFLRLQANHKDNNIEAVTLNISEGGIALLTESFIPTHCLINIYFILIRLSLDGQAIFFAPVKVKGQVRYCLRHRENQYRLGIRFIKASLTDFQKIANFVKIAS